MQEGCSVEREEKKNEPARRPFRSVISELQANTSAGLPAIFCIVEQGPVPIQY